MKKLIILYILLLIASLNQSNGLPKELSQSEFSIGKTIEIESKILDETRTINVYLPANYKSDSSKYYPVIYLLDGSKDEDFIHISGLVQFGSFSWINLIPESIVVGIGNNDRKKDFTYPSDNKDDLKDLPTSGQSELFIEFLEHELQPYINSKFKVSSPYTIIGQSLGGLLATEILFKKPNLFDNYIIVSPSLWWDNESLLKISPIKYKKEKSIFIAVGKEGEVMERTAKELYDKLEQNKDVNTELFFDFMETKTHGDALHIAVYNAFEKIFGGKVN